VRANGWRIAHVTADRGLNAPHYAVTIVGAGPTGLTLANLRTLLIERNTATVGEPRAVSIDDESLRALQNAGALARVLPDIVQGYGVHYYSWRGREFARVNPTSLEYGHAKRSAFRQPLLEKALLENLARHAHVDVRLAAELTRFTDDGARVCIETRETGGARNTTCDWLATCDGAHSTVREALGIPMQGGTFAERWLIVDLDGRQDDFRHTRTWCDPARPAIRLPGPHGTLRYEFMLFAHESAEAALDDAHIRAWMRARVAGDEQLPIVRKTVYTFHARMAQRWRAGRVLLAGDAAHLSPPFAGQGMNSGVRDAFNLAWKLAAVTRGEFGAALLDTYEQERKPHARSLIAMALRIGRFMQPKSRLSAMLMQGALRAVCLYPPARDHVLQLRFKPKPRYAEGFFIAEPMCRGVRPGQLLPQPLIERRDGSRVPLDDVLGGGFAYIGWERDGAPDALHAAGFVNPPALILLARRADTVECPLRDADGVIESVLTDARAIGVILRPDRYVLAYVRAGDTGRELRALLARHA
jgi:3-(3-hydroxy-phenyl)propionate hydroxylase